MYSSSKTVQLDEDELSTEEEESKSNEDDEDWLLETNFCLTSNPEVNEFSLADEDEVKIEDGEETKWCQGRCNKCGMYGHEKRTDWGEIEGGPPNLMPGDNMDIAS